MKFLVLSIIYFIFTSHLSAATCGALGSYVNFSSYGCELHENEESTIVDIDFNTGTTFCKYGSLSSETKRVSFQNKCTDEYYRQANIVSNNTSLNTELKKEILAYSNKLKTFGITMANTEAIEKILNTPQMTKNLEEISTSSKTKNNTWDTKFSSMMSKTPINSHKDYDTTISAIVAGVFTIDPKYFKANYVNSLGEVELLNKYKNSSIIDTTSTFSKYVLSWFTDSAMSYSWHTFNPLDIFDKQILGYVLEIAEAFRKVFNEMITIIYLLVGIFSAGYYSYMKFQEKKGKEPLQINNITFAMTAGLAFTFFAAPLSDDGPIKDNAYIIPANASVLDSSNYSSLAQESLRLAAQIGVYYGNMASDYVMKAHLNVVAKKMGIIDFNKESNEMISHEIQELQKDKIQITSMLHFYNKVCSEYYGKSETQYFRINNKMESDSSFVTKDKNETLKNYKIEANRLSYEMCSKLEVDISKKLRTYSVNSNSVVDRLSTLKNLHNTSDDSFDGVAALSELMIYGENTMGWIFSPSIPVSYYFFQNSDVFLYENAMDNEKRSNILSDEFKTRSDKIATAKDIDTPYVENLATDFMTTGIIKSGFWFLVPGFDKIYSSLDQMFGKMYMSEIDTYNHLAGKGNSPTIIGKVLNKIMSTSMGNVVDKIPGISQLLSFLSDSDTKKSKIIAGVLSILAFFIATQIIQMAIVAATTMAITAYLVFKILLYFIEMLMFFLVIPVLGIGSAILSKQGAKNPLISFGTNISSIIIGPVLIVFVTSLIVPITILFNNLFGALVRVIIVIIKNGETMLRHANSHANVDASSSFEFSASMQKVFTVASLEGMLMIFSSIIVLLLSLYVITTYKTWLTKLAGLTQDTDTYKELMSEVKNSAAGKTINTIS